MRNSKMFGLIVISAVVSVACAKTAPRPVFVCVQMSVDAKDIEPESLRKVERALNVSGAFLTTQITNLQNIENIPDPTRNEVPEFDVAGSPVGTRPRAPRPPQVPRQRRPIQRTILPRQTLPSLTGPTLQGRTPLQRPILPEDLELMFQRTLVGVCQSAFPNIFSLSPHSTPFRHQNCTVLCVYGSPTVKIPEGGMCYQQNNFVGTPGRCRRGQCEISGRPFEFEFPLEADASSNPFSRAPVAPGFSPDVHLPKRSTRDPRDPPRRR